MQEIFAFNKLASIKHSILLYLLAGSESSSTDQDIACTGRLCI